MKFQREKSMKQNWFYKKINRIDKLLARLKNKKRRQKSSISRTKQEIPTIL